MIINKSSTEAVSIKITATTARATYTLCSVGSHDSSSAAGSVRVQGQFEPRRVPQLRPAHHCDVPLGRVSAHTGTGDGWVADPLDVFRKTQDAVVLNLRHSKLAMPSFAACVAKLDEMNSSLRAG